MLAFLKIAMNVLSVRARKDGKQDMSALRVTIGKHNVTLRTYARGNSIVRRKTAERMGPVTCGQVIVK